MLIAYNPETFPVLQLGYSIILLYKPVDRGQGSDKIIHKINKISLHVYLFKVGMLHSDLLINDKLVFGTGIITVDGTHILQHVQELLELLGFLCAWNLWFVGVVLVE